MSKVVDMSGHRTEHGSNPRSIHVYVGARSKIVIKNVGNTHHKVHSRRSRIYWDREAEDLAAARSTLRIALHIARHPIEFLRAVQLVVQELQETPRTSSPGASGSSKIHSLPQEEQYIESNHRRRPRSGSPAERRNRESRRTERPNRRDQTGQENNFERTPPLQPAPQTPVPDERAQGPQASNHLLNNDRILRLRLNGSESEEPLQVSLPIDIPANESSAQGQGGIQPADQPGEAQNLTPERSSAATSQADRTDRHSRSHRSRIDARTLGVNPLTDEQSVRSGSSATSSASHHRPQASPPHREADNRHALHSHSASRVDNEAPSRQRPSVRFTGDMISGGPREGEREHIRLNMTPPLTEELRQRHRSRGSWEGDAGSDGE
ncbi:Nn.00g005430.m01.CDS01 [Neocucurbitaria sp. VM-36]